ncbi:hypothetical protein FDA94_31160 [Herbidospora galbida]|uniref:Uncharacterized protein n=1 Tax=Herbidospora galbida TaxID=2575442 RepID=A0A4U3M7M4_9ACTN|nr:hypothetical protein [Herbidospora galbida]TKK83994.1 hypothetical protein FDA94_31160 [Herbidospora galbida]
MSPPFDPAETAPVRPALIWAASAGVWAVAAGVLFLLRGVDPLGSAVWAAGLVACGLLVVSRRTEPEPVSALRWGSVLTLAGGAAALAVGGDLTLFLAAQALPVVVLSAAVLRPLARRTDWVRSGLVRVRLTWTVAGSYAGLIAFGLMQDLRGLPLIHPDVASLVTLGTMFEIAVAVAIFVLWQGRQSVTNR